MTLFGCGSREKLIRRLFHRRVIKAISSSHVFSVYNVTRTTNSRQSIFFGSAIMRDNNFPALLSATPFKDFKRKRKGSKFPPRSMALSGSREKYESYSRILIREHRAGESREEVSLYKASRMNDTGNRRSRNFSTKRVLLHRCAITITAPYDDVMCAPGDGKKTAYVFMRAMISIFPSH